MNKTWMIGNLCADPVARSTQGGKAISNFKIAVQRRFRNAQGQRDTDFFQVVVYGQTADFCNRFLTKGRKVAVNGSIQNRSYDAQDGSKRWVTEIIADEVEALGARENGEAQTNANAPVADGNAAAGQFTEVDPGDELPF